MEVTIDFTSAAYISDFFHVPGFNQLASNMTDDNTY